MEKERVLVVDDEVEVREMISKIINLIGHEAITAESGNRALEILKNEAISLMITDIKMPEMDGFELYRQIKKIDDKVKVCFLTAGEMDYGQFRKELIPELDKNCYIQKPIETEMLIIRLNRIIAPSN